MKSMLASIGILSFLIVQTMSAHAADAAKGQGVYMNFCAPCHATGVAGAPKTGDRAAWAPRISQGEKLLVEHSVKGFQGKSGYMPAKGGNSALSDAEVAAAVAYMVSQSK